MGLPLAQLITFFLLFSRLVYGANLYENPRKSQILKEKPNTNDDFILQKQRFLDELLVKVNKVLIPWKAASIPWDLVDCYGWPKEVKSKIMRDWTPKCLEILQKHVSEIIFRPKLRDVRKFYDMGEWKREDCVRILKNSYSNAVFDRLLEKYQLSSLLGTGGFAFVLKGEKRAEAGGCAVKVLLKCQLDEKHFEIVEGYGRVPREVDFLVRASHPSIIKLLDYFDDGINSFMITEVFGATWTCLVTGESGPDLFACIRAQEDGFPEEIIHFIFSQVYEVVMYLLELNIYHGDIKCENLLVDPQFHIKVIDFGLAKNIPIESGGKEGYLKGFAGTKSSLAPEILEEKPFLASEAETWSLGILLFLMEFFQYPFQEKASNFQLQLPEHDETGNSAQRKNISFLLFCRHV